ncbi:MAG: metalloregulator ArsR/SmtB family transcription factor [Bacilli bacterium]
MKKELDINQMALFLKIFGDSTRIRIILALDGQEKCVTDLCAILNMSKSAISHQLKMLKDTRIVKFRKDGKNVYFSLDDEHVSEIVKLAKDHIMEK